MGFLGCVRPVKTRSSEWIKEASLPDFRDGIEVGASGDWKGNTRPSGPQLERKWNMMGGRVDPPHNYDVGPNECKVCGREYWTDYEFCSRDCEVEWEVGRVLSGGEDDG